MESKKTNNHKTQKRSLLRFAVYGLLVSLSTSSMLLQRIAQFMGSFKASDKNNIFAAARKGKRINAFFEKK